MKIHLHPPYCLHELGLRENNEDCIYPPKSEHPVNRNNSLFMVCDGVGGAAKGEVASQIVCDVLSDYSKERPLVSQQDINEAIGLAEEKINNFISNHSDAKGMATTLTLLNLHEEGATIAHIGDSRVYHIRGGSIVFKTSDHSFVNELVAKNIISETEALNHPKRNVVTKAIMGAQFPQKADVTFIKNIIEEDYFFMCTDGVLESVSEFDLLTILNNQEDSNTQKIEKIKKRCSERSKDNFSAYLLQVERVENQGFNKLNNLVWKNEKSIIYALVGVLVLALVVAAFAILGPDKETSKAKPTLMNENVGASLDMLELIDTNDTDDSGMDSLSYEDSLDQMTIDSTAIDTIDQNSVDTNDYEF